MLTYPKPRIVISECLGVSPVRYDGNIIFDQNVESLKRFVEYIPVCPEVGIGLGVPRNPLVINVTQQGFKLVDTVTGGDLTSLLNDYAERYLNGLPEVDGFVLKSSSPSCGVGDAKVYDPSGRVVRKVDGLFTAAVKSRYPLIPVESEKRLGNYEIKRSFYTKVFTIAYIRDSLSKATDREEVVSLHVGIKYLLMLHDPASLKNLGALVADRSRWSIEQLKELYKQTALRALAKKPTRSSYFNVFQHMVGHVKHRLNRDEKAYLLRLLDEFKKGRLDVKTVVSYLKGFIYRFQDAYLAKQRFLQPYPDELD